VGFEPTIPAFERAKTVHVLDREATMIGNYKVILMWKLKHICVSSAILPLYMGLHLRNTANVPVMFPRNKVRDWLRWIYRFWNILSTTENNTIHIKFYIKLVHKIFILQFRLLCNTLLIWFHSSRHVSASVGHLQVFNFSGQNCYLCYNLLFYYHFSF
jgi:hypothetical protein